MGLVGHAKALIASLPEDTQAEALALLALAEQDFSAAIEKFSTLINSDPHHSLIHSSNLALTHLYVADGQSAISVLEPKLREPQNPIAILPPAIYNLCTMYEIRDDKARARKEGIMENIVGRYGDVCGKGHFKLDSLR